MKLDNTLSTLIMDLSYFFPHILRKINSEFRVSILYIKFSKMLPSIFIIKNNSLFGFIEQLLYMVCIGQLYYLFNKTKQKKKELFLIIKIWKVLLNSMLMVILQKASGAQVLVGLFATTMEIEQPTFLHMKLEVMHCWLSCVLLKCVLIFVVIEL